MSVARNFVGRKPSPSQPVVDECSFAGGMWLFGDMTILKDSKSGDAETLSVDSVDQNNSVNGTEHHTSEFDVMTEHNHLVIRRGQRFELTLNLNKPYNKDKDDLKLEFTFGNNPYPNKGTYAAFVLSDPDKVGEWGGWVKSSNGKSLTLTLTSSCKAPVGKWKMNIDVMKKKEGGGMDVYRYKHPDPIYILFNPWCKEDTVYLHEEGLRDEYVLNETGKLYAGSTSRISSFPWVFGQFQGDVLDCVLYLLDKEMLDKNRMDPVLVTRKISNLVNKHVLEGNWSGDYEGGTHPTSWSGSQPILDEYYKHKVPVKFGQCWVFSGVVTAICRALGIPCRSVTNFDSAHDTDCNVEIEKYYDESFNALNCDDSIWNFHVWNDVWMTRPLLPAGYGGWQAIDATPQEMSDGIYACGPMSLQAIRQGEVFYTYDGPFIFAEVNGDEVYYVLCKDGTKRHILTKDKKIGNFISTKKPNSDEREDITRAYKFAEGSNEERAAVQRAMQFTTGEKGEPQPTDVKFSIDIDPDTFLGQDAIIKLTIKNTSGAAKTVNGTVAIASMYYTGVHFKNIKKEKLNYKKIAPNKEEVHEIKVTVNEYMKYLTDHANCKVSTMLVVNETNQMYADTTTFRLRKPKLILKAPSSVKKGKAFSVETSFKNPLSMTLTNCELAVEGPGLQRRKRFPQSNVAADGTFTSSVDLTPAKKGKREVIVMFHCDQIYAVSGKHKVEVAE